MLTKPSPLDTRSLGFHIAQLIGTEIVEQQLTAGERLSEVELAERFQTSRSPIRDGLRILELEQLITIKPRRHAEVRLFDEFSIADLYLVRSKLFGLAAARQALSAERATVQKLEKLGSLMIAAAEAQNKEEFAAANELFHQTVTAVEDGELLTRTLAGMGQITLEALRSKIREVPGRLNRAALDHVKVTKAIQESNPKLAEAMMIEVILGAGISLLEHMQASQGAIDLLKEFLDDSSSES